MIDKDIGIEGWLYRTFKDKFGDRRAAAVFAESGVEGLADMLFDDVQEEITRDMEAGRDAERAFNEATFSWPAEGRALLARREARCDDRPDEYQDKTREYAEAKGVMEDPGYQTGITDFNYSPNPYDQESLTDEQAQIVNYLRITNNAPVSIDIQAIDDAEGFKYWLVELEDQEMALDMHRLDSNVPGAVAERILPPDEWTELDPTDVSMDETQCCRNRYYRVEDEEGVSWYNSAGSRRKAGFKQPGDERCYISSIVSDDDKLICDNCSSPVEDNPSKSALVQCDGVKLRLDYENGIIYDHHAADDSGDTLADIPDSLASHLEGSLGGGPASDSDRFVPIQPSPEIGDHTAQVSAMRSAIMDETESLDGDVIILNEAPFEPPGNVTIYVDRTTPEAAREAKSIMENAA
jgi:hypothetical protein